MAAILQELKPWLSPNFAILAKSKNDKAIPVSELPSETLDEMAFEWLDDLYRKAGKQSPWKNTG